MNTSELPRAVLSAIESGSLTKLQEIFESGMSVDKIAQKAARHGQPKILEWCFSQGWSHPKESLNSEFVIEANCGASPAVFQVLLNHGWDLNAHHHESVGDSLCSAVWAHEYEFAKWLLEHGHNPTPIDGYHGPSALYSTVDPEDGSIEMLRLLLDHGHDLEHTAAGIAAADRGNLEALRILLDRGIDIEDRDMLGYPFDEDRDEPEESQGTALYRACRQGQLECVKLLLDRGANPNAKDDGGTYCITIAKKRGHIDIVKSLEERGARGDETEVDLRA